MRYEKIMETLIFFLYLILLLIVLTKLDIIIQKYPRDFLLYRMKYLL